MLVRKLEEFGKAFFKRTAHAFGIPNEMPDSKGSEIFASVPGSKSGDCAVAFVLPDLSADANGVGIGNVDRSHRPGGCCDQKQGQADRGKAADAELI